MTTAQLKVSMWVRYVNVLMMWFFASVEAIPASRTGLLACSAFALTANLALHALAARTGRYRAVMYAVLGVDILTIVPAIYLTGVVTSPFLMVLPLTLNTIYFIGFNKRVTAYFGTACLAALAGAFAWWWRENFAVPEWRPVVYPTFTLAVMVVQLTILAASVYQSTYLPDPLLQEREHQAAELERQHHRAELGVSLAMVAHELRNPLTTISMGLEIAKSAIGRPGPAIQARTRESLDRALDDMDRVRRMLENLLSYARDRRGASRSDPVELHEVVERAVEFAQLKYGRHKIEFRVSAQVPEAKILGDRDALFQVLVNLIDNAAMSGAAGRDLVVETALHRNGERLELVVRDNGTGMVPEVANRVFDAFVTTRANGTGLGLPIVQRIITEHGGTIALNSIAGVGTEFRIAFPAIASPDSPDPADRDRSTDPAVS